MSALDRLLGRWVFTMHHSALAEPVTGHQQYDRVLGGAFVLQHWTYDHPDFPDAQVMLSATQAHYFDVRGVIRIFDLEIDDTGWSMIHLDSHFAQRFSTRFQGPDAMEGTGEASEDAGITWRPDFSISYRRQR